MSKITIKDIAKMLSVSISTVSRALADHPDISEDTKARIKETAQHFNYLPNLHARYFRKKNTKMIALIIPGFNRFFQPNLIEGIQKVIDEHNYRLIIFQSANDLQIEEDIIKYCLSWVVEGVLITLSQDAVNLNHLDILRESNIPVVLLDKVLITPEYSTVTIDDKAAAMNATKALIDAGKKKLLGVFGHKNINITKERLKGFSQCIVDNDLTFDESNYLLINDINTARGLLIDKFGTNDFDGVFFMTDELLVYGHNIVLSLNKKIPDEIAVVSISDGTSPYFLTPNITHIFHSGFDVGAKACELLFSYIEKKEKEIKHLHIETSLVDLGSILNDQ